MVAALPRPRVPVSVTLACTLSAILPDADVIAFRLGVGYSDLVGHRGLTHSIAFAAVWALFVQLVVFRSGVPGVGGGLLWALLFLSTASHGLLDAATNGGLGIAFFSPFSNARYFWPWRPIEVSPIGLGSLLASGGEFLLSEVVWIWAPCAAILIVAHARRRASAVVLQQDVESQG
jgi:inner membrane protein